MAGFGRATVIAAADAGNANRGSLRDSDELAADADRGFPTFGDRILDRGNSNAATAELSIARKIRG